MAPSSDRTEDDPMLRGAARCTAGHAGPGTPSARFARSAMAHAGLRPVDLAAARVVPGVVAAIAAADLDGAPPRSPAALGAIANRDASAAPVPPRLARRARPRLAAASWQARWARARRAPCCGLATAASPAPSGDDETRMYTIVETRSWRTS